MLSGVMISVLLSALIFCGFRLRFLMWFFQQEEYEASSFAKTVFHKGRLIDKKLVPLLVFAGVVAIYFPLFGLLCLPLFVGFAWRENQVMKAAKRKLAVTNRVKRIWTISIALTLVLFYVFFYLAKFDLIFTSAVIILFLPLVLVIGNILLFPLEAYYRLGFIRQAQAKLASCTAEIIGITGSYGKTSTKHILAHILSSGAPVLYTPGSVNTLMGVCRIINRDLRPEHKFFIVEMGAYYLGSIRKLCNLVHPKDGIITAIGTAHYARFKTVENVAKAKFELAEAVEENGGNLVLNQGQIEARFLAKAPLATVVGEGRDYYYENVEQTPEGLSFIFVAQGQKFGLEVPLFGLHHITNIVLAVTMALKLGVPMNTIAARLRSLPQIEHRLEVKRQNNGITIIDDAYNSNIDGFRSALGLLRTLKKGRNILMTPGMIEMGALHDKLHAELGKTAAGIADIVLLVTPERMQAFAKAFRDNAPADAELIEIGTRTEAFSWLDKNLISGDTLLIENDLLDSYEAKFSL